MTSPRRKIGKIFVPPGVTPDRHEKMTVDYLAVNLGYDITFLNPIRKSGAKTPDIAMNGQKWELKSPKGKSKRTVENNLRSAMRQSRYIVLDLRRTDKRIPSVRFVDSAKKQFLLEKRIVHLIIITREEKLIQLK